MISTPFFLAANGNESVDWNTRTRRRDAFRTTLIASETAVVIFPLDRFVDRYFLFIFILSLFNQKINTKKKRNDRHLVNRKRSFNFCFVFESLARFDSFLNLDIDSDSNQLFPQHGETR